MIFRSEAPWPYPEAKTLPQKITKVGKVSLEATAWISTISAAITAGASIGNPALAADMAHFAFDDRTPTEATLEAALKKAHGKQVMIRCANIPQDENSDRVTYGYTTVAPIIRIDDDMCDAAVTLKPQTEASDPALPGIARGVEVITHEYQHIAKDEANEGITVCYDIQTTEDTALALGASAETAAQIAAYTREDPIGTGLKEYILPDECRENGKYDLDQSKPGNFPGALQVPYLPAGITDISPYYYPDNTGFGNDQIGS